MVLVAEDDDKDVLLLEYAFRRANSQADLHFVSDGKMALSYLRASDQYSDRGKFPFPAVVLLDIKMPKMTGLDVLEAIRDDPDLTRLTVIIFSSSAHERDLERASDLHANSYLVKPSDGHELTRLCQIVEEYWLTLHQSAPCRGEQSFLAH
ncbi:MAG TPA: response regulator [Verrucomicrobiae bacterium]|nr:response regulator [Verrucomicrobiae bacterium]